MITTDYQDTQNNIALASIELAGLKVLVSNKASKESTIKLAKDIFDRVIGGIKPQENEGQINLSNEDKFFCTGFIAQNLMNVEKDLENVKKGTSNYYSPTKEIAKTAYDLFNQSENKITENAMLLTSPLLKKPLHSEKPSPRRVMPRITKKSLQRNIEVRQIGSKTNASVPSTSNSSFKTVYANRPTGQQGPF